MKNKPIDKIVLAVFALLFACVSVLNLCQKERPTVSAAENRTLATMPEFSMDSLLSGKYFAGISDFISDTFIGRDPMVSVSKKIDKLKSLSLIHEREGISVIIDPNPNHNQEEENLPPPTLPPLPTPPPTEPPPETTDGPTETVDLPDIVPITLSTESASFTAGASYMIIATVGTGYENLTWTVEGDEGIAVTDNGDGTATVTANNAGTATVTATVTGEIVSSAQCEITVNAPEIQVPDKEPADFLPGGMIIYDGAAHSQSYFSKETAENFATLYEYYATIFPETTMSVVIAPLSTITITDPEVAANINDQGKILAQTEATIKGDVNFVNLTDVYLEHADEYLYLKSDHHWTHRGAYYAYSEFAKSVGLTPTPIEDFEVKILAENYIGSMYKYTGDNRVATFFDTIEAYMPTKKHEMKIFYSNGMYSLHENCIVEDIHSYVSFICGDNGYTVINVPENPQDKNILVVKDSFGNAFVTYLVEHYGNIVVIDPRHADMCIHNFYNDYKFTDMVFMVNSSSSNVMAWYYYLASLLS